MFLTCLKNGVWGGCVLALVLASVAWGQSVPSVSVTDWNGYGRQIVERDGHSWEVTVPAAAAAGNPWLWCAAPPDACSALALALLGKGFHVVHAPMAGKKSFKDSLDCRDALYAWAVSEAGLAAKPVVEASRSGALTAYAWVARHPESAACIVAVMPWLKLRNAGDWGASEQEWTALADFLGVGAADAFTDSPLNQAGILGKALVPIMQIGEIPADSWVTEQQDKFYFDYRTAGQGEYETFRCKAGAVAESPGITFHQLYFALKHAGQLPLTLVGQTLPSLSEWKVADFSGQEGVYALDGILIMEKGGDMTGVQWNGPVPSGNYEITLEAMRLSGGDFFCGLTGPYGETAFSLVVGGWGGTCVGISSLDWQDAYNNETARFKTFNDHEWYSIRMRVVGESIQAWIDGEKMVDVGLTGRDVDIRWEMAPTKPLGMATWRTTGAVRNFRVAPL